MQVKRFLVCLMVYLVPLCLDAQTSTKQAGDSANISDSLFSNSDRLFANSDTLSAGSDSISANPETYKQDEEFEMFLLLTGSIGIGIMLMCVGIGAVVALIAFMILAGFVSIGIITTSVYIGLRKRSLSKGVNAFIMTCSCLFGIIAGAISAWALNLVYSWTTTGPAIATGMMAGLLGGLILGLFITRMLIILINFTDKKYRINAS